MKLTPLQLATKIFPNYQTPRHIQLFEKFAAELLATPGQSKGIVEVCVRHGKTEFYSKILPSWFLLNNPTKNVILASYSNEFARENGGKCRQIVQQYGHHFGVQLSSSRKQELWTTTQGGGCRTCGVGGAISGRGADLLIVDDAVKDQQQANSPTCRDNLHRWFLADCLSRLSPQSTAIVVMSRRHPDDLTGRLLSTDSGWKTLRLPALADTQDDPLGRQPGEPLWPERYDTQTLRNLQSELELSGQSHVWSCLYQQHPTGDATSREWPDNYFDNIWGSMPTENIRLKVLALDPSKGRDKRSNYSAFVYAVITTDGHVYVQSWLQRIDVTQLGQMAARLIEELQPHGFIYEGQFLVGLFPSTHAYLFDSKEDKNVRIRVALTPLLAARKLKLDPNSPGNRLLLAQLKEFPTSAYDDGPDSLVMALQLANNLLNGKKPATPSNLVLSV